MKKLTSVLLVGVLLLTGCGANDKSNTAGDLFKEKSTEITEMGSNANDSKEKTEGDAYTEISIEFLENRYPGKIIVDYLYVEPAVYNEGEQYVKYTDEEKVALNDYLTEKNKDYVINFRGIPRENATYENLKQIMEGDNPPDIITTPDLWNGDIDECLDNIHSGIMGGAARMVYDGLLMDFDDYKGNKDYENYINSMPSNLYELSTINGKFYGFTTEFIWKDQQYYVYNSEIAHKYDIQKNEIENKTITDIMPLIENVFEKEKDTDNFVTIHQDANNGFITPNIFINEYKEDPVYALNSVGVERNNEDRHIIAVTDSEYQKEQWKIKYDNYKKGYSRIHNDSLNKNDYDLDEDNAREKVNGFLNVVRTMNSDNAYIGFGAVNKYETVSSGLDCVVKTETKYNVINGICNKSDNKEMAIKALAFIYNDEVATNILVNGPDKAGYEINNFQSKVESDINIREEKKSGEDCLGNVYIVSGKMNDEMDRDEAAKSLDNAYVETSIQGYMFDLTKIKKQVEKVLKVEEKFMEQDDVSELFNEKYANFDEAWNDFDDQLRKAGIDDILKVINEQKDKFDN